jgi:hypothetical protein
MDMRTPERLDTTSPIREIVKSKSHERDFCGESKLKIYKMSLLDLDGSTVLPYRNQEDVCITIKSLVKTQNNVPLLRKKNLNLKKSVMNNGES